MALPSHWARPPPIRLGRAGLGGKVDSHFLKRFGSAILLSVVQSGLGLLQRGGNDVVVRTADDAKSVAGIALQRDINIPPTVKVAQGTAIRIFTARDLGLSQVPTAASNEHDDPHRRGTKQHLSQQLSRAICASGSTLAM